MCFVGLGQQAIIRNFQSHEAEWLCAVWTTPWQRTEETRVGWTVAPRWCSR